LRGGGGERGCTVRNTHTVFFHYANVRFIVYVNEISYDFLQMTKNSNRDTFLAFFTVRGWGVGELMGKLLGSFAGFLSESGTMNRGRGITAQTDDLILGSLFVFVSLRDQRDCVMRRIFLKT
jgi:hypothetical protein